MNTDEYFEADYVKNIGEEEANKTILLRKVDFANTYCKTAAEMVADMAEKVGADDKQVESVAIVFSSFGAALTHALFEED